MIKIEVKGVKSIMQNINRIAPREIKSMNVRLNQAGTKLLKNVKENASLTDHTLKQLAELGHPYSTRYGTNYGSHGNDALVHRQSGLLYSSIEKQANLNLVKSSVDVGVSEQNVPYIKDLITGTSKMRPRNFLAKGLNDSKEDIISTLGGS